MNYIEQLKRPYTRVELEQGYKLVLPKQTIGNTAPQAVDDNNSTVTLAAGKQYKITVKRYMTEKATDTFDFMKKFNNDIPMPFVTMFGTIEKETKGMYYMNLHAEPTATTTCMKCGRRLTNPVSMLYGLGPECGQHAYINPFETKEELYQNLNKLRKTLFEIKWSGWVIKSALKEFEELENGTPEN